MKKLDYVNLPGIANDQPDCFETPDFPTNDSLQDVGNDPSDAVNQFEINAKDAHDAFNGKYLNGRFANFADGSVKARGYVQHGIYQNYAEHSEETPIERYKRLMAELKELEGEFHQTSTENLTKEETENLNALVQHIQKLQDQTSKVYGAKFLFNGEETSQFLTKLAASKQEAKKSNGSANNSDTFKLFINPVTAATVGNASSAALQLSEMEQKVAKLENLVGLNEQQPADSKSLIASLEQLTTRLNLLDGTNLEHIDMKLANVLARLNTINEKKTTVDEQDKQNKAVELFEMMSRWETMAANLPIIQQRLIALNELHQQAFQFSSTLSHYEAEQQALKTSLDTNEQLLKQLKTTFQSNLESLKTQLATIDQKLTTTTGKK